MRLCSTHWREYKHLAKVKGSWLREMINSAEREQYYQEEVAPRLVSLDAMVERGQMITETMVIHRSPTTRSRRRPGTPERVLYG